MTRFLVSSNNEFFEFNYQFCELKTVDLTVNIIMINGGKSNHLRPASIGYLIRGTPFAFAKSD